MYLWKPCAPCNLQLRNCLLLNRLLPRYCYHNSPRSRTYLLDYLVGKVY